MEVMGIAEIVETMSDAYIAHAEYKKVPIAALQKLADEGHPMYLLRITPACVTGLLFDALQERGR